MKKRFIVIIVMFLLNSLLQAQPVSTCIYTPGTTYCSNSRLALFGNNELNTAEIWPIFSGESLSSPGWYDPISHPNLNIDDFLGQFLTDNSVTYNPLGGYTLACAENQCISDYTTLGSSSWTNNFNGFQWFTYSVLKHNPTHEIIRVKRNLNDINLYNYSLSNDQLTINLNCSLRNGRVEILNSDGKEILVKKIGSGEIEITFPMTQFESGIYFISVYSDKINKNCKFALVH